MRTGPTHIQALLRAHPATAGLMDRRRRDEGLLGEVRAYLPTGTRTHCLQAAKKGTVLTLTVDSPSWATRVRYLEGVLVTAFSPVGIETVKIRVRPPGHAGRRSNSSTRTRTATRLTPVAVKHLLDTADHIEDAGLAEALRRLARRHSSERGH